MRPGSDCAKTTAALDLAWPVGSGALPMPVSSNGCTRFCVCSRAAPAACRASPDGHTLSEALEQVEILIDPKPGPGPGPETFGQDRFIPVPRYTWLFTLLALGIRFMVRKTPMV